MGNRNPPVPVGGVPRRNPRPDQPGRSGVGERITNVLTTFRSSRSLDDRIASFRNVDPSQSLQVGSMIEGVHRRFIGGTYDTQSQQHASS